jgi:hypothetical protein
MGSFITPFIARIEKHSTGFNKPFCSATVGEQGCQFYFCNRTVKANEFDVGIVGIL